MNNQSSRLYPHHGLEHLLSPSEFVSFRLSRLDRFDLQSRHHQFFLARTSLLV
ncbi:hypothetical protein HanIR_Chr11g0511011 [Helianthus annuus]|nr:hypothetical protein HanIR_Chr11g0511011 [Helianthus annuus]